MTEPNAVYGNGVTPVIVLAGKAWPVPPLSIKQLRHVVPAVTKAMPQLVSLIQAQGDQAKLNAALNVFDAGAYDAMLDVIYWGLNRAHPTLTREEFDAMEVEGGEIGEAFSTVVKQSRMYKPRPEGLDLGEAKAQERSPTGTA